MLFAGRRHDALGRPLARPRRAAAAPLLRMQVLARRRELDVAIAERSRSDEDPARRLRAAQLVRPAERRRLARDLEVAVEAAERPRGLSSRVPVAVRSVRHGRNVLLRLAARLRDPEPVSACGVARVRLLLIEGDGPLYLSGDDGEALVARGSDALRALDRSEPAHRPGPGGAG